MTSCGLNGGPLKGDGVYDARIACNLWAKDGRTGRYDVGNPKKLLADHPYFTQSGSDRMGDGDQFIANMHDGAVAGFKYFEFRGLKQVSVEVRGAAGTMEVSVTPDFREVNAMIPLEASSTYRTFTAKAQVTDGTHPLYFRYKGEGKIDFTSMALHGWKEES